MILKKAEVGELAVNCYLCGDADELIIIDPGSESEKILKIINDNNFKVKYIVLTHCHYDHIGAVYDLKEKLGAEIIVCEKEKSNYLNTSVNLATHFCAGCTIAPPDMCVKEGDIIKSGEFEFKVIETPGHTSGGMCLYSGDCLFSGDTLFKLSIGRCDFPTGDMKTLLSSVKNKLFVLPEDTKVYPGHGDSTTIGFEMKNNMFF